MDFGLDDEKKTVNTAAYMQVLPVVPGSATAEGSREGERVGEGSEGGLFVLGYRKRISVSGLAVSSIVHG